MRVRQLLNLISTLIFFLCFSAHSEGADPYFTEAHERLMSIELNDGTVMTEAASVYFRDGRWYLPFGALTSVLNLAIEVNPDTKTAAGFFIDEVNTFALDLRGCRATYRDKERKYNCNEIYEQDDDFYLPTTIWSDWFPVQIQIDTHGSRIVFDSTILFPIQRQRQRSRQEGSAGRSKGSEIAGRSVELERKNLTVPVIDQQLQVGSVNSQTEAHHDTQLAAEIAGVETKFFLSGSEKKLDYTSLNLARKDPEGKILFGAKEIQAFEISLPSYPLIANGQLSRGILISSYPLVNTGEFGFRDFKGILPSGWEVELYQNDILIDRRVADSGTEYEFVRVPLFYGVNEFKLLFYGAQGQRREETQIVNIGNSFAKPEQGGQYRLIWAEHPTTRERRQVLEYNQNLARDFSITSAYYGIRRRSDGASLLLDQQDFGLMSLQSSLGRFLVTTSGAIDRDSRSAFESGVQIPFSRGTFGVSRAWLDKFRSDIYSENTGLQQAADTKLLASFGTHNFFNLRLSIEQIFNEYQNAPDSSETVHRASIRTGPIHWFNNLTFDSARSSPTGELSTLTAIGSKEFRTRLDYVEKLERVGAEVQHRLGQGSNLLFGAARSLVDRSTNLQASGTKMFRNFSASLDANWSTTGERTLIGVLSYGALFEPRARKAHFLPNSQSTYGAASILIFVDLDMDGKFSVGDAPVENVRVQANAQESKFKSDSAGIVVMSELPTHQLLRFSISLKDLPDPLMKPSDDGVQVYLRPGQVFKLELPIVILSEISGVVQNQQGKGKRNLELEVINEHGEVVAKARTDSEGFFVAENLTAGKYTIALSKSYIKRTKVAPQPLNHEVIIPPTGFSEDSTFDFVISE